MQRLVNQPKIPSGFSAEPFEGVVLFADISGFTPLSIQLAKMGPEGAEELDRVLNRYYGRLVEIIAERGGDIVAFAGDAAICVWPKTDPPHLTARKVALCALQIQNELHEYQVSQGLQLSVRISITSGSLTQANVGGVGEQWHPIVIGEALARLGLVADLAERGSIVVDARALQEFAPGEIVGIPMEDGHLRLTSLNASSPSFDDSSQTSLPVEAAPALRSFIPRIVLSRLDAGQSEWLADLRNLTVVFIRLHDTALLSQQVELCQLAMLRFQAAMERYEGDVIHFLQDDKGMIAVLCFGLPPNIHEDDAYLAIRSAADIQRGLSQLGLDSDIGISTGRIFSGIRGGTQRCEYSITGHIVNLAARLMSKAEGRVICDATTRQQVRDRLLFTQLPELNLKGIPQPVAAYCPDMSGTSLAPKTPTQTLVGRDEEMSSLRTWLDDCNTGAAGVLLLEGEAGIGKSMLLAELIHDANAQDFHVVLSECDVVERSTPYYIWRSILGETLQLSGLSAEDIQAKVRNFLAFDPTLEERLSLLNPFVDCSFPESDLVAQLSSEARAGLTLDLVLTILASISETQKLLLAIDDVQWMDSISWSLFSVIPSRLQNVSLALAARPFGESELADSQQLLQSSSTLRLSLNSLGSAAIGDLVCRSLDVETIEPSLLNFLCERSGGNPFFVEELVYFLQESSLVTTDDQEARLRRSNDGPQPEDVPTSVRALITRRVDKLPPAQQMTIKTASIVGRSFAKKTLLAIYEVESEKGKIGEHLERIQELRLIQVESLDPEESYLFHHLTVQQVVYDQIPVRNRRAIHLAIAQWYQETRGENPGFFPLLAYHWGQADVPEKEMEYLVRSAEEALLRFANHEVVSNLTRALQRVDSLPSEHQPSNKQLGHWRRMLGEAKFHLGDLNAARSQLEQAVLNFGYRLSSTKLLRVCDVILRMIKQTLHRNFPRFFVENDQVDPSEESAGGHQEAALAIQKLSQIHYFQVDVSLGFGRALWAMNLAEKAGRSPLLAQAYSGMCLVTGMLRMHSIAKRYAKLSLKVSEEVGHFPTTAYVLMATAVYRLGIGQWDIVRGQAQRSIELARRLSDQRLLGEAITVKAMLESFLADHHSANATYSELQEIANRSENTVHIGWAYSGLAESLFRRGDTQEALDSFRQAYEILHDSAHTTEEVRILGFGALGEWRLGNKPRAYELAVKALELAKETYNTVSTLDGIAGIAEVLLDRLQESPHAADLKQQAISACNCLKAYAGKFPIGASRSLCMFARLADIEGRDSKSKKLWRKSIRLAQQYELLYDEAYARWSLSECQSLAPDQRAEELRIALSLFQRLGCRYEIQTYEAEQLPIR